MIVDCHVHLNNYHEQRVISLKACLDELLATMEKNKVDASLVLTSYKVTEHRPPTRDVVEAVRDIPNVFVVAGVSYLNYLERDLRELAEFLAAGVVKGLKLYPGYEPFYPWDSRCRVIYDLCLEYDVPVMIHTGDTFTPRGKLKYAHPLEVDEVAVEFPELKIVLCHLGNPWLRDCMEILYKNRNCHADISGLVLGDFDTKFERWMREQIEEVLIYAGEPRYLLYGSDWPIASMESYLEFMRKLELPEASKRMILSENAIRLFKLPYALPAPTATPSP
ncbi:MAG: amidohydrolase family protein [Vicinamibacteria bacterium]|nr:amidohydrolase family protein [Vicinamibacteria bacterium]